MQINPRTTICSDHFTVDSFFLEEILSRETTSVPQTRSHTNYISVDCKKKLRRIVLRADTSTLDANMDTTATLSADKVNSDKQPTSAGEIIIIIIV